MLCSQKPLGAPDSASFHSMHHTGSCSPKPSLESGLSILRVVDNIVLFLLFTTPFCCGEYGAVSCLAMPLSLQYLLNSADVNSPPLSVLSIFNSVRDSVSTFSLNCLKASNA
ncbi:hypothetical protein HanRHA438_Chr04g0156671 [Helianthus annuus]|nr:hypothetical protein HanIR_Chr04g0157771 [Helianthus annuus]KAJ0925179.1 hypothetical protein HanRHA438_Chr04g0156671 [Helianthus annuus]